MGELPCASGTVLAGERLATLTPTALDPDTKTPARAGRVERCQNENFPTNPRISKTIGGNH